MTMFRLPILPFGAILLALVLFDGCGRTGPSRFYMLTPEARSASRHEMPKDVAIGVGPVAVPFYLDRPNIVTRVGPNQVALSEFDKWAGSLKENIPHVLSENLSSLLNTDRIEIFPWSRDAGVRLQLVADIIRMDAAPEEAEAVLEARWTLIDGNSGKTMHRRKSVIRKPIRGEGYPEIVAAISETLDDLCREIAPEILKAADPTNTR